MSAIRVLIIDDDAAVRKTMVSLAQACGLEALATDDRTFKEHLARWRPTLVILDLQMPGRDGIQILGDLASEKCEAHVILATGAHSRVVDAAVRIGRESGLKIAGTLQKPFQLETIRELLGQFKPVPSVSGDELAEAIKADQLFLEYQPKFDCRDRRVSGAEALVRWVHPSRGRLSPDQFIGLAEGTGLIEPLTDWVFNAAVTQAAEWRRGGVLLDVAINLSAKNLDAPDLPDRFAQRCDELALSRGSIILEVTESSAMRDPLHTLEVLTRLRLKGFKLSMDDLGTGYSSLVQLQRIPFSELKIDRSFITSMDGDESCKVIARIIIDLAHNLGLECVAEGVESEAVWNQLRAMGCDATQGYHLSRPVSPDRIVPLIETRRADVDAAAPVP
jgi:EAL domain-containing protein (putative c-di-GMP-specific phosphodiesterase class I)